MISTRKFVAIAGLIGCFPSLMFSGQPSFEGPVRPTEIHSRADDYRAAYLGRIEEVQDWISNRIDPDNLAGTMSMAAITVKLVRDEDIDLCNRRTMELMEDPRTGPFWMFPVTMVAFAGRDLLSEDARHSIREAWRTTRQLRGDTENHWVMYYVSLYLMSELYPDEAGDTWYTGRSSTENLEEAKGWILDWMDIATTVGQGEYNPSHYIGEYAIAMLMLASWAEDRAMRQRGQMMLDWIFAELATVTLDGVMRGPNSRTGESSVVERWNALASSLSWMLFGNTPPTVNYGGWGMYFAAIAQNYQLPEVIYQIAVNRPEDILQKDRARSRRIWRYSDQLSPPIYKTQYLRDDYAVGSYQGGISDPIQTHVWDVTWRVPDPRRVHPTLFSMHPHSSGRVMQMFFCTTPDPMPESVTFEGKPSYNSPDKILGCSPFEQVYQDLDTVVALYDIEPGERFPHINGFFSKDLENLTEDPSGWIFAQGGRAYLAYRPLAPYEWMPYRHYFRSRGAEPEEIGGKILMSPHLKNGTIVQAASADEFESFEVFQAAIRALPLKFSLEPMPTVKMTTLRGSELEVTYGQAPRVDGKAIDYTQWKLFEGPHLNAEVGGRKLTITHGRMERVLDFNTLSITDRILP